MICPTPSYVGEPERSIARTRSTGSCGRSKSRTPTTNPTSVSSPNMFRRMFLNDQDRRQNRRSCLSARTVQIPMTTAIPAAYNRIATGNPAEIRIFAALIPLVCHNAHAYVVLMTAARTARGPVGNVASPSDSTGELTGGSFWRPCSDHYRIRPSSRDSARARPHMAGQPPECRSGSAAPTFKRRFTLPGVRSRPSARSRRLPLTRPRLRFTCASDWLALSYLP
jgi:hypothetical protein